MARVVWILCAALLLLAGTVYADQFNFCSKNVKEIRVPRSARRKMSGSASPSSGKKPRKPRYKIRCWRFKAWLDLDLYSYDDGRNYLDQYLEGWDLTFDGDFWFYNTTRSMSRNITFLKKRFDRRLQNPYFEQRTDDTRLLAYSFGADDVAIDFENQGVFFVTKFCLKLRNKRKLNELEPYVVILC